MYELANIEFSVTGRLPTETQWKDVHGSFHSCRWSSILGVSPSCIIFYVVFVGPCPGCPSCELSFMSCPLVLMPQSHNMDNPSNWLSPNWEAVDSQLRCRWGATYSPVSTCERKKESDLQKIRRPIRRGLMNPNSFYLNYVVNTNWDTVDDTIWYTLISNSPNWIPKFCSPNNRLVNHNNK